MIKNIVIAGLCVLAFGGCKKSEAASGSSESSGSSEAKGDAICPEGSGLCVSAPEGYQLASNVDHIQYNDERAVDLENAQKVGVRLYWLPKVEEYDNRVRTSEGFLKAKNGTSTPIADGKGVYHEYKDTDGQVYFNSYVKTATHVLQCSARSTPERPNPDGAAICKSLRPK